MENKNLNSKINKKTNNINKISNKKKNNSPKKLSTFMLCGMLLLIIIVTLIYFLIIYYKPEYIVKYSGYAVKENVIEKNLKSENIEEVEKYVEMVKVEESSQNYVTSYNPETGTYEVYSVEEIINNNQEEPESETQKIQANGLQQFYESYNTSGKKTKIEPGLVIIITTITAIGILSIAIIRRAKYAK